VIPSQYLLSLLQHGWPLPVGGSVPPESR
jgi:hypothetical protein